MVGWEVVIGGFFRGEGRPYGDCERWDFGRWELGIGDWGERNLIGWFSLGLGVVMVMVANGVGRWLRVMMGDRMAEDRGILVMKMMLGGMVKSFI